MNVEKRIHEGWLEWLEIRFNPRLSDFLRKSPLFGKYQYIFTSEKGLISLIELPSQFDNPTQWEICSHEKLFSGVQRFCKKEDAEDVIREYLE